LIAIVKQEVFTFCKMSESEPIFEHIHSKFAKSGNIILKNNYFQQKFNMGYQKTQNFMLILNSFKWAQATVLFFRILHFLTMLFDVFSDFALFDNAF
jgi:hypothetical protein